MEEFYIAFGHDFPIKEFSMIIIIALNPTSIVEILY